MTVLLIILKAWLAMTAILLVRCFCRAGDIGGVAIPGALVLMLCGGIWELL